MGVSLTPRLRRALRPPGPVRPGAVRLDARGVGLTFGDHAVLADVDVAVRGGEVLALVGPNGAGKSTLLAVLAGDVAPDAGAVTIDGAPASEWTTVELAWRRGVLLQQVQLSFPFTVGQVVRMGRTPYVGTPHEDADELVVARALADTDLAELAARRFPSLSGGEQARAALARVLAQEPGVLLLDEPTAALDLRHQEQVLGVARGCAARGDAVVVVMHDLAGAAAHADRVVVMAAGRMRADGPPEAVLTAELLTEVYEHPIEVLPHPRTGRPLVLPHRGEPDAPSARLRTVAGGTP
jgi:iron complex transport system ATP-binding protein